VQNARADPQGCWRVQNARADPLEGKGARKNKVATPLENRGKRREQRLKLSLRAMHSKTDPTELMA
jgi:hypothetical protein